MMTSCCNKPRARLLGGGAQVRDPESGAVARRELQWDVVFEVHGLWSS